MDDELRFHFEMRVAEFRALGMSQADAEAEATRRFGDSDEYLHRLHNGFVRLEGFGDLLPSVGPYFPACILRHHRSIKHNWAQVLRLVATEVTATRERRNL